MNTIVSLGMSLALGYAGFVRGRHIQRTCPTCKIALPTLGCVGDREIAESIFAAECH